MTSNSHHTPDHEAPHDGPIKTPKQLIWAVLFAFLIPILGIILLVTYVGAGKKPGAGTDFMAEEAVARRIQPVGTVEIRQAVAGGGALKTGEQVFQAQCAACHGTGAAGAPKFGDEGAWAARIKNGYEALLASALKGKNAMPPQGGGAFSEVEIGRAVVYMANKGGAKFEEPKAPAGAATAAAPTDAAPAAAPAAAATTTAAAPAAAAGAAAPALYTQTCQACHAAGVAGAPKVGDKAAWAPRVAQGIDALTANAIKGKGAMPPKGGSAAPDADIKAVVTYMVNASK
ncbi:c-type cytochrome [Azohydromonas caseinilytica]|uniref:Cytochrome c5 family protein n=1 Tax=Azohydromonas caseinilytica TaxID=2728836 RepID=A0A848F5D2_9BURK|nr:c-type cytochrome [Azohydromonas caseinilytica]NML13856.1 cytochrome c5 family protein [Azohydromonas caseinilytica]